MLLLERDRVTARLRQVELLREFVPLYDRVWREARQPQGRQQLLADLRLEMSHDRLSGAARVDRRPRADAVRKPNRLRRFALVDIKDLLTLEDSKPHSLAGKVPQPLEFRLRGAAQVQLAPNAMGHLEQAETESIRLVALVGPQQSRFDEGREHAMSGAFCKTGLVCNLAESERPLAVGHDIKDAQAAAQRLRARDLASRIGRRAIARFEEGQPLSATAHPSSFPYRG